jgi:hyaluronoglucosaminidase
VLGEFPKGIVEGFYGPPWSHLDRLYMIKFLSENGFNTYMYAPKDDPYHRSLWREDYPGPLAAKLRELVQASSLYSVDFIFTVSPGLSVRYSDRKELQLLLKKLQSVIDAGCNWIGVMLDDIDTELKSDEDIRTFSSLAKAHAYLLNSVLDELRKNQHDLRVSFCPTYYANDYLGKKVQENDYLSEIGSEMKSNIDVLWTGRHVVSTKITENDVREYERVVRRKPILWDNYPVNDYFRSTKRDLGLRLNLGPFAGRAPMMLDHLAGYLSNPMNECEASKISLLTLRDMLESPFQYSPTDSLKKALQSLSGSSGARKEIDLLIEAASASPLDPNEARELNGLIDRGFSVYGKDVDEWRKIEAALRSLFHEYFALEGSLQTKLRNRKLFSELEPILVKLQKLAALGERSLDFVDKVSSPGELDTSSIEKMKRELDQEATEVRKDKTQVLGQMDFGTLDVTPEEGAWVPELDEVSTDLGLPHFKSESRVIALYEWARGLSAL